jgi:predicted GNAT superfamily acetyltransferase
MLLNVEASPLVHQAQETASRAAGLAKVRIEDETDMDQLRSVAALLISVWGTSQEAAPIPADLLRSISHAGCNVAAAYDESGVLCGAAVAIVAPENSSIYSLIAGVLPGIADAGVGFALKLHQRAWALERGFETMTWTFDPLVSRNARFNLTKLGAHAAEYVEDFYGLMEDEININDESDRLVAVWPLASDRVVDSSQGYPEIIDLPDFSPGAVLGTGPDGHPMLVEQGGVLWCRVPTDILALRAGLPALAAEWRIRVREVFTEAFAAGRIADGVTRTGWYRLTAGGQS